jgi:hypothetical protein
MLRTLKIAALASTVILATTVGAFAYSAWSDGDSKVKDEPGKWADTVDYLHDGEKVEVLDCFKKKGTVWCEIEHKGPDGYVRKSDLDFHKHWDDADFEVSFGSGGLEFEIEF